MRAMILAAGRGERMGELTQHTPKPLLRVGDYFIIEYAIANCIRAGIHDIVINVFYLAAEIKRALGDGQKYGVRICYSEETERVEVGGGIVQALPLLGHEPFIVMSGDVITDYPLQQLQLKKNMLAHLILVDNPDYHPQGDFGLQNEFIDLTVQPKLTFGNIGLYHPTLFLSHPPGFAVWRTLLLPAIENQQVTGEYFQGRWHNIGNPQDLKRASFFPIL
jgi:N-acetyl-alpha-D-muramate 1-phosphate uridylyltransferase